MGDKRARKREIRPSPKTHLVESGGAATSAFYANAPRDEGNFLYQCDEYGILESALMDYVERLEDFFDGDDGTGN